METSELLQSLNTHGHHMLAKGGSPMDLTKGVGLALLALEEILRVAAPSEAGEPVSPVAAFKAKSNRW